MNRQTRTLIVLAVAVVTACVASYSVYRAMRNLPQRASTVATRKAIVAAKPMPLGTLLTVDNVRLVDWPAATPLVNGFSDPQSVVGRGLIAPVDENEPLTESKLAPKGAGAGLPPTIAKGMRAISIKVNEVIGVAGFVVPGTHVDVVTVIAQDANRNDADKLSRIVLSDVTVLSAGTRYDQDESKANGKPIRSTVVTLMVSPADAERLSLAQSEGELMLALRNPLDTEAGETHGVTKAVLFSGNNPTAPHPIVVPAVHRSAVRVPAPTAAPELVPYKVETIRAAKRAEEIVQ